MAMIEERRDYAVLISLAAREEAEVAAAALRADGIDAFIGNSNHSRMDWFYVFALGGLQIMVPRQELLAAKTALLKRISENAEAFREDRIGRRDRWKIWVIAALSSPVLLLCVAIIRMVDAATRTRRQEARS
jgi:hypothetical protein